MENYKHLFPAAQPPYGVEASGGTQNRPEYIVPVDDWWPDLTKPLTPVVEITAAGVQEHPENGSYGGSVSATAAEGLTLSSEVGTVNGIYIDGCEYTISHASKWTATGDSTVVLMGDIHPEQIDGNGMITIHAHAGEGCELSGTYALESGGKLIFDL